MRLIFSLNVRVQTMDFGRQRGFLLDGEEPPEKVGCRKESYMYFLEFMYIDVARDFAIIIIIIIIVIIIVIIIIIIIKWTIPSPHLFFDIQL